jgi:hypothetical protein
MVMKELPRMGIREARVGLGRYVDQAHYLKQATVITKNGVDMAFVGPVEWLQERDELEAYRAKYGPLPADS